MRPLRFIPLALSLGLFLAITFTLCLTWGLVFPHTELQRRLLEALFPGFTWLSWGSYVVGLAESFLYGVYAAAVFVPLYNGLNRQSGEAPAKV